jgi:hypothetical protein
MRMKLAPVVALVLAAAYSTVAQLPQCPIQMYRKVSKASQPGKSVTIKLKVANPGSRPVLVNVQIGLPDNVCAVRNSTSLKHCKCIHRPAVLSCLLISSRHSTPVHAGVLPSLKRTASPSRLGATVVNQNANWLSVPIAAAKSRTFNVKARVSSLYPAPATPSISALALMFDENDSVICLSTMADASVSVCGLMCVGFGGCKCGRIVIPQPV